MWGKNSTFNLIKMIQKHKVFTVQHRSYSEMQQIQIQA